MREDFKLLEDFSGLLKQILDKELREEIIKFFKTRIFFSQLECKISKRDLDSISLEEITKIKSWQHSKMARDLADELLIRGHFKVQEEFSEDGEFLIRSLQILTVKNK